MALSAAARRVFTAGVLGICLVAAAAVPPAIAQVRPATTMVTQYAGVLRSFNPGFSQSKADDMATHVLLLASYYDLDPRLLVAIVGVESRWHASAVSPSGAQGLGQLMPGTAQALAVQSFQAYENLDGTARYLRRLLNKYWKLKPTSRYSLAIAGYNAGPEAVRRYGGVPPYAETKAYVHHVISLYRNLQRSLPRYAFSGASTARATIHRRVPKRPLAIGISDLQRVDPVVVRDQGLQDSAEGRAAAMALGLQESQALEAEAVDKSQPKKTIGAFFRRLIGKKPVQNP
jgi:hypothetical protein